MTFKLDKKYINNLYPFLILRTPETGFFSRRYEYTELPTSPTFIKTGEGVVFDSKLDGELFKRLESYLEDRGVPRLLITSRNNLQGQKRFIVSLYNGNESLATDGGSSPQEALAKALPPLPIKLGDLVVTEKNAPKLLDMLVKIRDAGYSITHEKLGGVFDSLTIKGPGLAEPKTLAFPNGYNAEEVLRVLGNQFPKYAP